MFAAKNLVVLLFVCLFFVVVYLFLFFSFLFCFVLFVFSLVLLISKCNLFENVKKVTVEGSGYSKHNFFFFFFSPEYWHLYRYEPIFTIRLIGKYNIINLYSF